MKFMKLKTTLLIKIGILGVGLLMCSLLWAQEQDVLSPQLIVHSEVHQEALSPTDVCNIFLGRKTTWKDRSPIILAILKEGPVHQAFLRTYVKKSPAQFNTYWRRKIFTGQGSMPKAFDTESKLMNYVAQTKGAVGYVNGKMVLQDVKVLKIKQGDSEAQ